MAEKKKSKGSKEAAMPTFDEAALSKLTAKIDTELSKPKEKDQRHKDQKPKNERPGKRKRNDDETKDANPKKRQTHETKNGPGKPAKAAKDKKPKKAAKDKNIDLLEEIKALGGDEADLDLVAGLDSDAEEGQGAKPGKATSADPDKALKKELAKFAAGLGFEKVRDEDGATDDELEEQGRDDEAEDGEDEDWEDEPEHEKKTLPAEKAQGRSAAGKLVSQHRQVFQSYYRPRC